MTPSVRKARKQSRKPATKAKLTRKKNVVPGGIDLRDRLYTPAVAFVPSEMLAPEVDIPVLAQRFLARYCAAQRRLDRGRLRRAQPLGRRSMAARRDRYHR